MMNSYNPDVLSCLANLSNDEVFTPPEVANAMLDLLPQELFSDPNTTFLDPACKSGVFLREIAKRLLNGQLPGWKQRVETMDTKKSFGEPLTSEEEEFREKLQSTLDHIFHKQLFGIAITELTSLLSRRSVYCSKYPNSKYSVSRFDDPSGNIRYKRIQHRWQNKKCVFCGASQGEYDRDNSLETYAYEFIHTTNPEKIFKMKFDVIIGNPPYQLSDGGHGASAIPIYQRFVQQSKKLLPRFLVMITPSRWFTGGRGLEAFRNEMLHDKQLRIIHDYLNASDCFPGVEIKGGVSFFLWEKDYFGDCEIYTHQGEQEDYSVRPLLEEGLDVFIRDNKKIEILRKVQAKKEPLFYDMMSANDPFGYDVRVENSYFRIKPDYKLTPFDGAAEFYYNGWRKEGVGYIDPSSVRKGYEYINKWKILIPRAWGSGNPESDRLNAFIVGPNAVCTETYSVIGPFHSKHEAENVLKYMNTRFFHFMVSIVKITQAGAKHVYKYVPAQNYTAPISDDILFKKYELSEEEIRYITKSIWPVQAEDIGGDN